MSQYIEHRILPHYPEREKNGQVPRKIWNDAGSQGWFYPTAEQKYGGLGADLLHSVVLVKELSFHGTPRFFISLHNDIVFPYLEQFANETQMLYWAPGCVSGETILALTMTEPGHGSDLGRIETSAVSKNGGYIINGSKIFICDSQLADLFIVAVRTSVVDKPHDGISLLLVPADSPGYTHGRNLDKIVLNVQDTTVFFFDACIVPAENLLREENGSFGQMMQNLQQERLFLDISAVSHAAGALEYTLDYVKSCEAFGKRLSRFQHIRFEHFEVATRIQVTQSFIDDLIPTSYSSSRRRRTGEVSLYDQILGF